jgi:hypothetical protein
MGFPAGMGLVRIQRPHAYWKKSWQGSTDVSMADIINAEALTQAVLVHKPHPSSALRFQIKRPSKEEEEEVIK